jgi:signal transduction histidine kinase
LGAGGHQLANFLVDFAETLAGAGHDEPPARAWSELLPKLCRQVAGNDAYVAALWIADDEGGTRYTLWHQHKSETETSDKRCCVSIVAASPSDHDLRVAFELAHARWADGPAAGRTVIALPLIYLDRKRPEKQTVIHLGAISISLARPNDRFELQEEVKTATTMASSWLRLNREARVMRALGDLQDQRQSVDTIGQLANMICAVLANHANARRMCAVYVPEGDRIVRLSKADSQARWHDVPIAAHDAESPLTCFHFGKGPGASDREDSDIALLRFDRTGARVDERRFMREVPLKTLVGIPGSNEPPSVLLVRVRDRNAGLDGLPPAIATLVLVCEPLLDPGHESIGGTFTQTHQRTVLHALDYFRNSYSLLLQRERMVTIGEAVAKIAMSVPDIMDERTDQAHLPRFAQLACETIPSVIDAVIIERRPQSDETRFRYHRPLADQVEPPDWLPRTFPSRVRDGEAASISSKPERYLVEYSIRKDGPQEPEFRLTLLIRATKLSMVERHLVEHVIAETRAELHRHLQRSQWEIQLAEVRHNLRSVVSAVLVMAEKIFGYYWPVKRRKKSPVEVNRRLIIEAGFHKAISDLEYSSNELLALTENIRTISGGGLRIPLQIGVISIPSMVSQCVALFRGELERRQLRCHFNDESKGALTAVTGDRHWLHILIFNLLENAVKYSRQRKAIAVRLWIEGSFWRLEVINEGKYIPPEMRQKIFDPYTRVPAEPGEQEMPGSGLGLTSIKAVVEMHQMVGLRPPGGESITVDSRKDELLSTPGLTHARNVIRISIPRLVRGTD